MESHVLTTTHFPTKPFISVSFFLLEYYNFRRYFQTLECENKKQGWTEQMIAFGASEYGWKLTCGLLNEPVKWC